MICRTIISQTSTSSKKVQNSDLRWGPLHCKIGVLILQILFWKYLRLNSRVKYLKFIKTSALFLSALVVICNCLFHPLKLYLEYLDADKMRGKAGIWKQIKWEAKFTTPKGPPPMHAMALNLVLECNGLFWSCWDFLTERTGQETGHLNLTCCLSKRDITG